MSRLMFLEDSRRRPETFHWNGAIDASKFRAWLRTHGLEHSIPDDLSTLWQLTGGGDFFESETILGPFGDSRLGDDVLGANDLRRRQGMPERFLVFSVGAFLGAVDASSREFVDLDRDSFRVRMRFGSLNDWYVGTVRAEFGRKYGLV